MENNKDIYEEMLELKKTHNGKKIKLNKEYYVSEWSWTPIADGYSVFPEIIRYAQEIDGYMIYTTGTSCRYYFAWDIHELKEDARRITDIKNSYCYDWCTKIERNLIDESLITKVLK